MILKKLEKQSQLEKKAREMLEFRGVVLNDIAELVFYLQAEYQDNLTIEECIHNVNRVLAKREVQHAVLTGIELDILAEKGLLSEPLQDIISRDEGLYGIDEVIALDRKSTRL